MDSIDQTLGGENQLNYQSKEFLKETAKWTKFLSIIGFIGIGFMVIAAFTIGSIFASAGADLPFPSVVLTLLYLVLAAIYVFPILYLYKFSVGMTKALNDENDMSYAAAFENLKSHYKFVGIFTIIILGFYVLSIMFSIVGALFMR
ncbi:MAG: hypothetical protein AB8B53_15160 [Flavobacteriales bacterium]